MMIQDSLQAVASYLLLTTYRLFLSVNFSTANSLLTIFYNAKRFAQTFAFTEPIMLLHCHLLHAQVN